MRSFRLGVNLEPKTQTREKTPWSMKLSTAIMAIVALLFVVGMANAYVDSRPRIFTESVEVLVRDSGELMDGSGEYDYGRDVSVYAPSGKSKLYPEGVSIEACSQSGNEPSECRIIKIKICASYMKQCRRPEKATAQLTIVRSQGHWRDIKEGRIVEPFVYPFDD
jgi:hypothetical protein